MGRSAATAEATAVLPPLNKAGAKGNVRWEAVTASVGIGQPGNPEGHTDTGLLDEDHDLGESVETAAIPLPHFFGMAMFSMTTAHNLMALAPLVRYTGVAPKYRQEMYPAAIADEELEEGDEIWSESATEYERIEGHGTPMSPATVTTPAHAADQEVGENEAGQVSGAIGVWAIAGPA